MAKLAIATIRGNTPYSQSRPHRVEKLNKELPEAYEERTWKERLHVDENGMVFIPPMAPKNCLAEMAKYLGLQIPGKGKSTYTKHFEAGVLALQPCPLGIHKDQVPGDWVFVPADGVAGSGKRVYKCYPVIPPGWQTKVEFHILDDVITKEVFMLHFQQAGQLIGLGRFRPRNRGYYGRFDVLNLEWSDVTVSI